MAGGEPALRTEGLTKIYHDPERGRVEGAVDVSFSCETNQIFGLLGPNGAGKTTTLRMLSTVLTPTEGSAEVMGHDVRTESQVVRGKIGFLSGETGLYPRLTAREMVAYFGRLYELEDSVIAERSDRLFELMDMEDFQDQYCENLSTGQKQKVSISRTLIHDPPVLILDEPTSGLDVMSARTVMQFIRECREEGKCVLFSTHNMTRARRLCDRMALIHGGRIQREGSPQELMRQTETDNLEDAFLSVVGASRNEYSGEGVFS